MVLVTKKDERLCVCVDYLKLNSCIRADAYSIPQIDDLIDEMGQAKYISTLVLSRGYWQVPVIEADRYNTAFVTPYGLYQF